MILIDSNVLIDVIGVDQAWQPWSRGMIRSLAVAGEDLGINPIVIAEIAGNAPDLDSLLTLFDRLDVELLPLDVSSAFAAGSAYRQGRRQGDDASRQRVILADFLIRAHASSLGPSLLTRDPALYRRHFPDLDLITPETHP